MLRDNLLHSTQYILFVQWWYEIVKLSQNKTYKKRYIDNFKYKKYLQNPECSSIMLSKAYKFSTFYFRDLSDVCCQQIYKKHWLFTSQVFSWCDIRKYSGYVHNLEQLLHQQHLQVRNDRLTEYLRSHVQSTKIVLKKLESLGIWHHVNW